MSLIFPLRDKDPWSRRPVITGSIIALNILFFLFTAYRKDFPEIARLLGAIPSEPNALTFISSLFLHGDLGHLLSNMLFLWAFGPRIEDELGRLPYLLLYLAGGIAATGTHFLAQPEVSLPLIGASGAISSIMGIFLLLHPFKRIRIWYLIWIFVFLKIGIFRMRAIFALGIWFLLQVAGAAFARGHPDEIHIAFFAHIGGFGFGLMLALILRPFGLPRRTEEEEPALVTLLPKDLLDPRKEALLMNIIQHLKSGEEQKALYEYEALSELDSGFQFEEAIFWRIARLYFSRGLFRPAAEVLKRGLSFYPQSSYAPEARLLLGGILALHLGKKAEGIILIREAMKDHPRPERVERVLRMIPRG